jgi:vancomycin permeability regulator SanA
LRVSFLNAFVIEKANDYIITPDEAKNLNADCIIVLGAMVYQDGSLSDILKHRVMTGVELYNIGASDRLLMSGDNSRENYNESAAMKAYAVKLGVAGENVFQDYAGFSTYETMYRARDVFQAKKVIIVTQKFHISRAVYLARSLGLEAYGVVCDRGRYKNEKLNNLRETGAR